MDIDCCNFVFTIWILWIVTVPIFPSLVYIYVGGFLLTIMSLIYLFQNHEIAEINPDEFPPK